MRIGMISYWTCPLARLGLLHTGGMNVYVLHLSNALGNLGHEVHIYTRNHKISDEKIVEIQRNVKIIHLPSAPGNYYQDLEKYTDRLIEFIKKNKLKYDILHAHYYYSGLIGLKLKQKFSLPLIQTFHTLGVVKEKQLGIRDKRRVITEKKLVSAVDGIVSSTEFEKRDLIEKYQTPKDKIAVLPPGVNHKIFKKHNRQKARIKLKLDLNHKIILFVGRIDPVKGISFLIESVALLIKRYPDFPEKFRVLLIGGDIENYHFWQNSEVKKIKNLIIEKDLECCIKFIGSKPHTFLPLYYSAADVVVAPSVYESFGLVVLEAMACGSAVIASKVGGLKFLIKDRFNGRLFQSGKVKALGEIILELLKDNHERKKLGEKAQISSLDYCWDIQAKKIIRVYGHYL